ncbi:hypothetical protein DAPK24_011970 [Pichia kluyveri]|uniref:WD40 repeat-like protein n=1 Tax=Pichia kluyveri TaxID=36015 RepID=A0AAV5R0Q1_PICKL|nr:hypothetical protein DAPK24_011970 [Pichia kluyveri]
MYVPLDISRYTQKPVIFAQLLATNIYPTQTTDPNIIYNVNSEEFKFTHLDQLYEPDYALRIARTPLSPNDPSTYAALSKFTEYNLRKFHSSSGALGFNQLDKPPLSVPKELIASHSDGKTEISLIGSMLNPLVADCFNPVHLIPGCVSTIVRFKSYKNDSPNDNNNTFGNKIFGKSKNNNKTTVISNPSSNLRLPKNNLTRNSSTFVERYNTCDGYVRKLNNSKELLVSAHGRIINIININDTPKDVDVEPPCVRIVISNSVITCVATFQSENSKGEKDLDILFGFATGDILWFNPFKMKYTRWNKNGKLKSAILTSIQWSKCGNYAFAGFEDGELIIFDRNFEDSEFEYQPKLVHNQKYMKVYKSLKTKSNSSSLLAHYKFTKSAITSIKVHPVYDNIVVLTSDDGFVRILDLLTESLTDITPIFYGGALVSEFTPDGRFLLVGGEDDLVSAFEFFSSNRFSSSVKNDQGLIKLVSRLQGAKSWVRDIQICKQGSNASLNYTICTSGDDGYVRFYEFQPRSLRKGKKMHSNPTSYLGSPRYQMNRALSSTSIDPSLDSKRKDYFNKSSNTLNSMNLTNSKRSLMGMINQDIPSPQVKEPQSQVPNIQQLKLNDGFQPSLSTSITYDKDVKKAALISKNYFFAKINISPKKVLLHESVSDGPFIHSSSGSTTIRSILPVSEKNVNLGRIYGTYLNDNCLWAFMSGGDLIRWKHTV